MRSAGTVNSALIVEVDAVVSLALRSDAFADAETVDDAAIADKDSAEEVDSAEVDDTVDSTEVDVAVKASLVAEVASLFAVSVDDDEDSDV